MNEANEVQLTPRTWVRVRVTNKNRPVLWDGKSIKPGETFEAEHYQVKEAIRIGQVELDAVLPGFDPQDRPAEPLAPPTDG